MGTIDLDTSDIVKTINAKNVKHILGISYI